MMQPRPLVVIGIDPGVSTGVAIATLTDEYHYTTATCTEPEQVWEYIRPPVQIVIVEKFSAQLISKYGLHTVGVWWGVKALCHEHRISIVEDTPQQRRPYLEMARSLVAAQKDMTRHDQRHEIDAMSHVVRYLYQQGYITSLKVQE